MHHVDLGGGMHLSHSTVESRDLGFIPDDRSMSLGFYKFPHSHQALVKDCSKTWDQSLLCRKH